MAVLLCLHRWNCLPSLRNGFCCGWILGWVESSANKNWQLDFFWSARLSWCYGNLHHLKMWLRHILKKKSQLLDVEPAQSICNRKPCVKTVMFQIRPLENIHKVKRRQAAKPDLVLIQLPVRHQSGFLLLGFTFLRNSCSFLSLPRSSRALVAFVCD